MAKHQYARKFKGNQNVPFVLVNRRLFTSLYAAEEYCMREGLDVNTHIQYEPTQEFKQEAVELAKNQIAVLSMTIEALEARCETLKAEHLRAWAETRHAEETHDLLSGYYRSRAQEYCAKVGECYDCKSVLWKQREELYKITGWHE